MMPGNEDLFVEDLARSLRAELAPFLEERGLVVESHVKVLTDLTVELHPREGEEAPLLRPILSFLELDLVVGRWAEVPAELAPYTRNLRDHRWALVPRVAVEVKYRGVDSQGVMTASEVAQRVRRVYRDVRYFLLIRSGAKQAWTLERHGSAFDRIYQLARCTGAGDPRWAPVPYEPASFAAELERDAGIRAVYGEFLADVRGALLRPRVLSS